MFEVLTATVREDSPTFIDESKEEEERERAQQEEEKLDMDKHHEL